MARFTLAPVADRIRRDVLILAGTEDHYIPLHQTAVFEKALVGERPQRSQGYFRSPIGGRGALPVWDDDAVSCRRLRLADRKVRLLTGRVAPRSERNPGAACCARVGLLKWPLSEVVLGDRRRAGLAADHS